MSAHRPCLIFEGPRYSIDEVRNALKVARIILCWVIERAAV